ncbi:hypothetical protein D0862_14302 [Hortaea werneckii]|uniref:NB-ARC domain-containing protein n=1 Tax=Hortaea werneckii TaxID=91943 RepID=A0A3M7EAB5_HORWE|nr:hypothetical protein D0862_14302 [Hortaea werneckii]
MDPNLVSNKSFGAGGQENLQQIGGSRNVQYNADIINYHGGRVQEPTRTPPPPSSTVPFHRDPNFVDRPELETLEEKLSVWNKKVALVGIGGVGKSQLAIEFCYRVRERSPEVWTFWVHASSAARFDADIRKLACDAGIPGWNDPKSDAFALVENDENARIRMAYLPPCAHGSVLITSRCRAATARLADECDTIIVGHMGETTALALLEKKLGQSTAIEDMQKLAVALDNMPLALAQAGAYIKRRSPRYSVARYLAELEQSEKSQTSLLSSASKELRRDEEAQNSIILTLQISFQHVLKERPSAADLLSLMSMYNYQGIPEYLLKAGWSGTTKDFDDNVVTLEDFLFINTTTSTIIYFEMHRLVQVAARAWLRSRGNYQEWAQKACRQLDEAVPNDRPDIWGRCEELYPHVTSTLNLHIQDDECSLQRTLVQCDASYEVLLDRASNQFKAARVAWRRGLYSKPDLPRAESYETIESLRGRVDLENWLTSGFYGSLQTVQEKCEAMSQALKGFENERKENHCNTLTGINNLASASIVREKFEALEEATRQALEAFDKMLGREHPAPLTSVSNLASVLGYREKYETAGEAPQRALEGFKKVLGREPHDTMIRVWRLGDLMKYLYLHLGAVSLPDIMLEKNVLYFALGWGHALDDLNLYESLTSRRLLRRVKADDFAASDDHDRSGKEVAVSGKTCPELINSKPKHLKQEIDDGCY